MKMKRCTAAILLMLSLEALAAGSLSAAVAVDGADNILLPSQGPGVAGHEATEAVSEKSAVIDDVDEDGSPWKCCDLPRCTRSLPPVCQCLDKVKKCAKTCKNCEKAAGSNGASPRFVCRDTYGKLAPRCTKSVASGHEATSAATEGASGWKCCDPVCAIKVPSFGRCPFSGRDLGNDVPEAEAASEKIVAGGEEQARPWTCCDDTLCTRSAPPTCQCLDKVKKCAKTCKSCEKADGLNGASSRFVCHDRYFGWPGPKCGKSGAAADVILGN